MTATAKVEIATTPWQVDASHTTAQFAVRHLMISTVKGWFSDVNGTVIYDPAHPELASVDVKIPVATITTRDEKRDAHLKSPDFFDAEKHPWMTFKSKRIVLGAKDKFTLIGDLTIRGVTREVQLAVTNEGSGTDPWGNERMGFSATGRVNRQDFGLKWNVALETGGVLVGDDVKIALDIELVRPIAA
jgi:polyisoprenoid-binding protein YceI